MALHRFVAAAFVGLAPGASAQTCSAGKTCPDPDGGVFKKCSNVTYGSDGCGYTCFDHTDVQYWCDEQCGNCKHAPPPMSCPEGPMCADPDGGAFKKCVNQTYNTGGCGYTCFDQKDTQYWCDNKCGECKHGPPAQSCPTSRMCKDPEGGSFKTCQNVSYGANTCGYECYDAQGVESWCDNNCEKCGHPPIEKCPADRTCKDPDADHHFTKCLNISYPGDTCGYTCWDSKNAQYWCDNNCGHCKHSTREAIVV